MDRRERYRTTGPGSFGDAELVALVLGTGTAGRSAMQISVALLETFGGLAGLAGREPEELRTVPGVGAERSVRLHAALHAGRRACDPPVSATPIRTPIEAWRRMGPALTALADEELHGLYLDRRRRPLAHRSLTRGSDAFTVVDPRQIFRVAVGVGASAVILAHNHPSGDPTPSAQDRDVTRRVAMAGRVLGIPLVDHIVVGAGRFTSLAEQGDLPAWTPPPPTWTS